jgi:hypothetical protein
MDSHQFHPKGWRAQVVRLLQKFSNGIIMVSCASNALRARDELSGMCSRMALRGMRRVASCSNNG